MGGEARTIVADDGKIYKATDWNDVLVTLDGTIVYCCIEACPSEGWIYVYDTANPKRRRVRGLGPDAPEHAPIKKLTGCVSIIPVTCIYEESGKLEANAFTREYVKSSDLFRKLFPQDPKV